VSNFTIIKPLRSSDLAFRGEPKLEWIWQGYIAPGNVTLFTGLWKTGKTTLLALLLARRNAACGLANSTPKLAGLDVKPGKTLVITEEDSSLWAQRFHRYNYTDQVYLISRPFNSIPSEEQWRSLLDQVHVMHEAEAIDLLIADQVSQR